MSDASTYIQESLRPLQEAVNRFASDGGETKRWNLCLVWPLDVIQELTVRIINLRPRSWGENSIDRLEASLMVRYEIELTTNLGVLLRSTPKDLRQEKQDLWMKLREMTVFEDNYGIPLNHLSERTATSLKKKSAILNVSPQGHQNSKEAVIETVLVEDKNFRFDDPWGLNMSEKVKFLPLADEKVFLDKWKMYSHISHASAFSIHPTWIHPIPRFDAILCLSIVAGTIAEFIGFDFDTNQYYQNLYKQVSGKSHG